MYWQLENKLRLIENQGQPEQLYFTAMWQQKNRKKQDLTKLN